MVLFFFSVRGEGKYEKNYKKKIKKIFFSPFGSFFTIFGRSFAAKGDEEIFWG